MNENNIIIYNTADGKASVSLLAKDGTVGKMRLSLFDRCLTGNLKLLESRCKVASIKGYSVINLFDACLICKNLIPKKELNK